MDQHSCAPQCRSRCASTHKISSEELPLLHRDEVCSRNKEADLSVRIFVLSIQRRLRVTCVNLREADRLARLRNLFVSDTREQVVLSNLIYFWIDSMAPQMADIRRKQIVSRDNYLSQKTINCLSEEGATSQSPEWGRSASPETIICLKRQLFVSKDNYLSQKTIICIKRQLFVSKDN